MLKGLSRSVTAEPLSIALWLLTTPTCFASQPHSSTPAPTNPVICSAAMEQYIFSLFYYKLFTDDLTSLVVFA